ncbi:MAG: PQQ-binding-like beta-propeller repeat protein [Sulfolobaceae archaeon]|nr:PQQ-binding-like beta-propeller repeat protein [Sulfolobaceae archaeon]
MSKAKLLIAALLILSIITTPVLSYSEGYYENTVQFEGNYTHVYHVNITTGYFSINVSGAIIVPPSIYGDYLIVTTSGPFNYMTRGVYEMLGCVYAINIFNGKILWKDVFPNQIMTQPIIVNGTVIVGLGNNFFVTCDLRGNGTNEIVALNVKDGKILWNYSTLGEDMPTPAYYDGLIIEANGNGCVFALNMSGYPVWKDYITSYDSMSSILLVNGTIYFGSAEPYVFWAINATNGKIIWFDNLTELFPNETIHGLDDSSPAYYNGIVVTSFTFVINSTTVQDMLMGLNATNGKILWFFDEGEGPTPPNLNSPPEVIYDGIVFHDTPSAGILYAINLTNGKPLWKVRTGPTTSNVNIYNNYALIQNASGTLFVINITNGSVVRELKLLAIPGPGNLLITKNSLIAVGLNGEVQAVPLSLLLGKTTHNRIIIPVIKVIVKLIKMLLHNVF